MRNVATVIDEILAVAPDLEPHFKSLKTSMIYSAPESMPTHWHGVAAILNEYAIDHPKRAEIIKVFSGNQA